MITFLFWNIAKNPIYETVARLAHQHKVDIVILAECDKALQALVALNTPKVQYEYHQSGCSKIHCFSTFPRQVFKEYKATNRMSLRRLQLPTEEILIVMAHLVDPRSRPDAQDRFSFARNEAEEIQKVEKTIGHRRTVVIGDFNMNPYDKGLSHAHSFNAVMSRNIARKQRRTVNMKEYPYFYNPMWGRFGDLTPHSAGTIYYHQSDAIWNMYDQVLIRPDLLHTFQDRNLHILDSIEPNDKALVHESGIPNDKRFSDHLPLLVSLDL